MIKKLINYLKENHIKILIRVFKLLIKFTLRLCGLDGLIDIICLCIAIFNFICDVKENISKSNQQNENKR